ncbi:CpaF family protein [Actinocatenispora rupis]|uniref:Protein kinase n=1 Tax=Actinocatenispora rupis TaxID=519421 RepID=A0A8J3ND15_9ACTN|nr:ATPase, T2SS/T4P/T4SS family [Actinocatenispora rupis]GID14884.1 protein kinase [Actinocatenispora rupis]
MNTPSTPNIHRGRVNGAAIAATPALAAVLDPDLVARVHAEATALLTDQLRTGEATGPAEHDTAVRQAIEAAVDAQSGRQLAAGSRPLDQDTRGRLVEAVRARLTGLGPMHALLADERIESINVNGCDNVHVRYADGTSAQVAPVAASDQELVDWVRQTVASAGGEERRFDRGSPTVSAQLPDGSRLFAVMALSRRVCVSLRRFRLARTSLASLQELGTVDAGLRAFLAAAVRARRNILISGGTALGKTTLLRALAAEIPDAERLITVEDALELGLDRTRADVVALQAREPNIEGQGEVPAAALVRAALRMSPDRVIVGEVRGDEVIPMLNAMSQGCDGSMGTVHASTSAGALLKLAAYAAQGQERLPLDASALLIGVAVHLVVHLEFAPDRATRVVSSIREVVGADGQQVISNEVYRPGPDRRARPAGGALSNDLRDRLTAAGFDPAALDAPDGWWT